MPRKFAVVVCVVVCIMASSTICYAATGQYSLLTSGRLNDKLIEVDEWANDFMYRVTRQMAKQEGVTEKLKAEDMMAWVGRMNNIKSRAEEMMYEQLYEM